MIYSQTYEPEIYDNEVNEKQNRLITIDELIKEYTDRIYRELNEAARKAFNSGKFECVYYIPITLWETEEFIEELKENMILSGWSFGEIENFNYEGDHKKKVRFIFCEEG